MFSSLSVGHGKRIVSSVFFQACFLAVLISCYPALSANAADFAGSAKVSAAIDIPGDEDSYTFNANVGETIQIRMAKKMMNLDSSR